MDPLNIVISGKSQEAFDFLSKLSESRHHIFMNSYTNDQPIDLLIIFEELDPSLSNFVNEKTVCFCFTPSISINVPSLYYCHFVSPEDGAMQDHLTFELDTEVQSVDSKFSQIYGALISIGYEISFNKARNPAFQHILAASSIRSQAMSDHQEEAVVARDPKSTPFHLIVALDCTGSMSVAISSIQTSLLQIIPVIKEEFPKILISFYAFRDYCDPEIIHKTVFEEDSGKILKAIERERADGGGDTPEAHKTCLAEIRDDISKYGKEMTNVCFLITDAPPHINGRSGTYEQEIQSLYKRDLGFGMDWINLANTLSNDGIQVFSFLTNRSGETSITMSVMSRITHGLCFIIPNSHNIFKDQMISIVSNLMNNSSAKSIEGIQMVLPDASSDDVQKEQELMKLNVQTTTNHDEIQNALTETGQLMRLKPSDRGARRVTISSSELVDTGILAIKALKSFYQIIQGDESSYSFFDETPKFKSISKELKEIHPTIEMLSKSSISCICSMMTVSDAFELLNEVDIAEIENTKNITKMVEILGNFVIGYPFLFQLTETGKFNMQDAWPIIFKDSSTAYTMSISSLYHIISTANQTDDKNKMINKFKDFVMSQERSGIVPICPDLLTKYALKILDVTKWLDALVSYGLHRHIEPLPAVTRAACCAFIINISRQGFFSKTHELSSSQKEALKLVSNTLSCVYRSCESMMNELNDSIVKKVVPFNAYSPQEPFVCSTINKIVNCFFQLNDVIRDADRDYMKAFFFQGIAECIALFAQFLKADEKDALMLSIFDDVPVNPENVTEKNPLEVNDPLLFKEFVSHEIENFKTNRMSSFVFKVVWSLIRDDEFEEPTNLMLTAALALAISTQTRSYKYKMIEKDETNTETTKTTETTETNDTTGTNDTNDTSVDEKPKYEINPLFATQDPIQLLGISCFIYFNEKKKESIKQLQANRKKFMTERSIENLIEPFKACSFDQFFTAITTGFKFEWMEEPFKLDVINTPSIVTRLMDEVKQPMTNSKEFYQSVFYVLFLGNDQNGNKWAVDTCRDIKIAQTYNDFFLEGDKEIFKFYLDNRQRTLPNRHGHNPFLCPNQDEYTEEYARKRIICNMAPFYFYPELPKKVKRFDTALIKHLAHKKNAPPEAEIFKMALRLRKEIQNESPDCEKPPPLKARPKRRKKCFRPRRK